MANDVEWLAALIRRVDGDHSLGAAELAEALIAGGVQPRPATAAEISEAVGYWRGKIQDIRRHL